MVDQTNKSDPPDWQQLCKAAEREVEPAKLLLLLGAAEEAIFLRLQQLNEKLAPEEREAIAKATQALRRLQVERLNFPDWEPGI